MRTVCAFDHRWTARERRAEGAGVDHRDGQIRAQLADGGWRTAFRYRGGFHLEDAARARVSALAEMAEKDPQFALDLAQHASELESHMFLGAADGGDVHTWVAILEATGAFERMIVVVETLRRGDGRKQMTTATAIACHAALARAARWNDLLRLHPDPLVAVAEEAERARWVRRSRSSSAPWGGSRSTRLTGEQIHRRSHELYSALLSTRRDTEAEAVARVVLAAEPTASNHLGLVAAALRVGRRLPAFTDWLAYAATHGEPEDIKRAAWLRAELALLPPD